MLAHFADVAAALPAAPLITPERARLLKEERRWRCIALSKEGFSNRFIARRVGEYAFVRPAREMLFSRVDNETKYKAKNVIDVPVYRGADALSAQVNAVITSAGSTPAHIALMGAGVAVAWLVNGWILGRKADSTDSAEAAASAAAAAPRGH